MNCNAFAFFCVVLFGACHSTVLLSGNKSKSKNAGEVIVVDPRYSFRIDVDFEATTITVNVEVQTTGFVGFGISPDGVMWGGDIFAGGVKSDGTSYHGDYMGMQGFLIPDQIVNWELLAYSQNTTHTLLTFTRLFDTGDAEGDVPITNEDTYIIWSIGQTDDLMYHGPYRGAYPMNILEQFKH